MPSDNGYEATTLCSMTNKPPREQIIMMRIHQSLLLIVVIFMMTWEQQVQGQRGDFAVDFSLPETAPCDAYRILDVEPPKSSNSTVIRRICRKIFGIDYEQRLKRIVWKWHGRILPMLHLFDKDSASETYVNLRVLWNKAISSLDSRSPAYEKDNKITYQMLPRSSRWILRVIPSQLFPRWFHANIELRTTYLNQAVEQEIVRVQSASSKTMIRVLVFGGGYDPRPIKLLNGAKIQQAWEFDLPPVAESKASLIRREKLLQGNTGIQIIGVDLNDQISFRSTLAELVANETGSIDWHTIIISEALFLYLEPGVPAKLLQICQDVCGKVSFCFADRLFEVPPADTGDDQSLRSVDQGREWFSKIGWTLVDWLPKDGATKHLGIARPI